MEQFSEDEISEANLKIKNLEKDKKRLIEKLNKSRKLNKFLIRNVINNEKRMWND